MSDPLNELTDVARGVLERLRGYLDPWESIAFPVSHQRFSPGSKHPFRWYFERESQVPVSSVADIETWLIGCQYQHDRARFAIDDHWQHPCDFEESRRGDCEDHALWAWRKLTELGHSATLVVGKSRLETVGLHAWVLLERSGTSPVVFEATGKRPDAFEVSLSEARDSYRPYFGVDAAFRTIAYLAYVKDMLTLDGHTKWTTG